jgi:hypothetical protein
LIHALGLTGIRGRALNLIGRGEEDEASPEPLNDLTDQTKSPPS